MSFNKQELLRIQESTSGFFKSSARKKIASALNGLATHLESIRNLGEEDLKKELIRLMNAFAKERQAALSKGAKGYGDSDWAQAAACESWVQEILSGNPERLKEVEQIVSYLIER